MGETSRSRASHSEMPALSIRRKRVALPILTTVVIGSIVGVSFAAKKLVPGADEWLAGLGDWAWVAYLAIFTVGIVLFAPASLFCIVAGAFFGLWWGSLYAFVGGVLGSTAAFLIARTGARGWIEEKLRRMPRFEQFDDSLSDDGLKIVFLIRLSPIMPMAPVSYAMGVSSIRFRHFLMSMPAMLPGLIPFVYAGNVAGEIVAVIQGEADKPWWEWVILGVGFVATGVAAWLVGRRAKRAIEGDGKKEA